MNLAPLIADLPVGALAALFRTGSRELTVATLTGVPLAAWKNYCACSIGSRRRI
jgi:hypothetical protein